ncbi:N-ATPase subunit AtpR [Roseinatronobacter sp.]|uniref:N-ATPase subunit AtpR n=1 Tax=Roseinatronobacter sp. TaxID=1945755 RepID=UPI003425CAF6
MTESFAIFTGSAFGLLYMSALWVAVRVLTSGQSLWLFAALGLLRASLLMGALWLAIWSGATAAQIAFGTLGFIAVRLFATRFVKPAQAGNASWK